MQDALQNLLIGFSVGLTPQALLYAGCVIGTLVGKARPSSCRFRAIKRYEVCEIF